ncbi:40S ribosomal protein S3A [Pseudoloma neurophilia]|uniref:40S ribosomal protein S3A n=1 Tax=Pseudoloma neurophilia TaxID=146866 RepID=A0A0R0M035_9MICR|nr:40S ribosomal protein S3A [Pseudoloma neurophilia]
MALKPQQQQRMRKKKALNKKDANKKETYNLTVPFSGSNQNVIGQTIINKQNTEIVAEKKLKGRVFEVFQQDMEFPSNVPRKLSFLVSKLKGKDCKSHFNGLRLSTDKSKSIIKKWHSLIETETDILTNEGIKIRIFYICTTKRDGTKRHGYIKTSLMKEVRKNIDKNLKSLCSDLKINELVKMVLTDKIDKSIEEEATQIVPLQNCHVRKIKVVKRPKEVLLS